MAPTPSSFPRQDIFESEKKKDDGQFYKNCLNFAVWRKFQTNRIRTNKIIRNQNSYNGIQDQRNSIMYNRTYGPDNVIKMIPYRLSSAKMDNVIGQQLQMPLNGTVYVTNPQAKVKKLEDASAIVGLHFASQHVDKLRGIGVDIFNGMNPPKPGEGETIFDSLSPKSANEMIMQIIANRQIPDMNLKLKINECMRDMVLQYEAFGKVYINENSDVVMRPIPCENMIFEESENDPFLDNSPYMGEMRIMYIHDILREFKPDKKTADELYALAANANDLISGVHKMNYNMTDGQFGIVVYTLQWMGCEIEYLKKFKSEDGEEQGREIPMSQEYYEKNKKRIDREVELGKYEIAVSYKSVLYECVRAGHGTFLKWGKVENMPASINRPSWTMRQYQGVLFNTINGVRVSLKQKSEHIDEAYDLVMWQIRRELAKAKGKVVVYDYAMAPNIGGRTLSMKEISYRMVNDGLLMINTSADGNASGRDINSAIGIKEIDLGVSASVQQLLLLKTDLENMSEKITGILDSRFGQISPSASVGNTQASIQGSQTTTAPLFYFFAQFVERLMKLVLEESKISWGILKPEKGEMVLGQEGMRFLTLSPELCFDDYGYSLGDVTRDMTIRNMLKTYIVPVLNAEPTLLGMALEAEMAETTTEAVAKIKSAIDKMNSDRAQEAAAAQQAQIDHEKALQSMIFNSKQQDHVNDLEKIHAKGVVKQAGDTQKAMNQGVHLLNQAAVEK